MDTCASSTYEDMRLEGLMHKPCSQYQLKFKLTTRLFRNIGVCHRPHPTLNEMRSQRMSGFWLLAPVVSHWLGVCERAWRMGSRQESSKPIFPPDSWCLQLNVLWTLHSITCSHTKYHPSSSRKQKKPLPLAPLGQARNKGIITKSFVLIFSDQSSRTHTVLSRSKPSPSSKLCPPLIWTSEITSEFPTSFLAPTSTLQFWEISQDRKLIKIPSPPYTPNT